MEMAILLPPPQHINVALHGQDVQLGFRFFCNRAFLLLLGVSALGRGGQRQQGRESDQGCEQWVFSLARISHRIHAPTVARATCACRVGISCRRLSSPNSVSRPTASVETSLDAAAQVPAPRRADCREKCR